MPSMIDITPMSVVTEMMTPRSVRNERSLCDQSVSSAMRAGSRQKTRSDDRNVVARFRDSLTRSLIVGSAKALGRGAEAGLGGPDRGLAASRGRLVLLALHLTHFGQVLHLAQHLEAAGHDLVAFLDAIENLDLRDAGDASLHRM